MGGGDFGALAVAASRRAAGLGAPPAAPLAVGWMGGMDLVGVHPRWSRAGSSPGRSTDFSDGDFVAARAIGSPPTGGDGPPSVPIYATGAFGSMNPCAAALRG